MGSPYIGLFMGVHPQLSLFFLSLLLLKEEGGVIAERGEAIEVDEDEEEVDKVRLGNEQVEDWQSRLVVCILGQWSIVNGEEEKK